MKKQKIIDIMFQVVEQSAQHHTWDRENLMAWVRGQYRECGLNLVPMGSSWGEIVKEPKEKK
jgi:hypothetical protein